YHALAHPSLPNYLALVAGSTFGLTRDHVETPLEAQSIVDRLEQKRLSWKAYAEDFPGSCFLHSEAGKGYLTPKASPTALYTKRVLAMLLGCVDTPGRYSTRLNHYSLLRTIEDNFGLLPVANGDANATPLPDEIWR